MVVEPLTKWEILMGKIKKLFNHKKYILKSFILLIVCAVVCFSVYGGIKWYKYHKTNKFYYELCMALDNGYFQRITKAQNKNYPSVFIKDLEQKRALVTDKNCRCVARWESRMLNREYILDLMDRIKENIANIRDYDTLQEALFTRKISELETEVYVLITDTEIDLQECAAMGFEGKLKALEDFYKKSKSELDTVGVGHMYKPKTYNVLN